MHKSLIRIRLKYQKMVICFTEIVMFSNTFLSLYLAINMGALALLDDYPASIRLLCTMSGSTWDNHYFDDHKMSWVYDKDGTSQKVASNGALETGYSVDKFSMMFDSRRYYSILTIKCKFSSVIQSTCHVSRFMLIFMNNFKMYLKVNYTFF
jgi:hypothetical protein